MSKAPIASEVNPAKQEHSASNEKVGNLSEELIRERFETLAEPTKRLFEELETEFEKHPIDSVSDILKWSAYLNKTLETPGLADLFTKWRCFRGLKPEDDPDSIQNIDFIEFRRDLEAANWKYENEAYDRVFHLMWNIRSRDPLTFMLKSLEGARLGVTLNARCIIPQDPSGDSLEAYDVIGSNFINILRLRYLAEYGIREMIIAPFGQLVYANATAIPWQWSRSEYVLVLEIRDDGTAGDFYFVYNDVDTDTAALSREDLEHEFLSAKAVDDTIDFKPVLCGQGPFTEAKVKGSLGLGLLGCRDHVYWQWMYQFRQGNASSTPPYDFHSSEIIQLDFVSTTRPEIVMTGIRKSQKGREIVGLYDNK